MTAKLIIQLYIIFFCLQLGWETCLELLNMAHVRKNAKKIPEFFKTLITPEDYSKSIAYTITREKFSITHNLFSAAIILSLILSGLLGGIDSYIATINVGIYTQGILFIIIIFLIFQLSGLPFSLYSQFVIEKKFGFNTMTPKLYFLDLGKQWLLSAVLGIPLLYLLFWFMDRTGNLWWLWAFGLFTAFQLVLVLIYPTFIAPLFNKFAPLEEGSLREKIYALAEKLKFKTGGIFVMDGSRRSRHSNAYFTGMGKNKRIVLYDTLLKSMEEEEILGVLAHEIGHQKKNHLKISLILSFCGILLVFYILSLLLPSEAFFSAFQFQAPGYHSLLVLLLFCAGPFTFFLQPLSSILSRRHEYQADTYAVRATGNRQGLMKALLTLGKDNLSNLTPHPLYSFFYYSHPALLERITALEKTTL